MSERKILIVDDNRENLEFLGVLLERYGWESDPADSGAAALRMLEKTHYDIVITDLMMPAMNGIELLGRIKEEFPGVEVVIVTAYGSIPTAIEAIKRGAYTYLLRPFEPEEVALTVKKIFELIDIRSQNSLLKEELSKALKYDKLVGSGLAMQKVYRLIDSVAVTNSTVLVMGESGCGKELIARAIHMKSQRAEGPFVKVSCAALPETLLEAELFGHEKGAFTGAVAQRKGRFELADRGTLFLDEIGEIPLSIQVKLLRVIQEREFERLGGTKTIKTDTRIISATNRNLKEEVEKGNFREDLYYRLNVITIEAPTLREHKQDIPTLAYHFLNRAAAEAGKEINSVSDTALAALAAYDWPGNVRELQNIMERAVVLCRGVAIEMPDLPDFVREPEGAPFVPEELEPREPEAKRAATDYVVTDEPDSGEYLLPLRVAKGAWEKNYIERALAKFSGNISHTADAIEIARKNLQEKIKAYDIDTQKFLGRKTAGD
ncbi:MAG: sigma-54-dependent Fis family transcriptional regulator [Nitrospinae bacterium]|nr:sigma-54-dependent Fis family transcriptional regulator [Nitrospinota bacterium]